MVQEGATIRLVCRAHVPPAVDDAWAPSALGPLARWSLDGRPITSDTWRPSGVNVNTELSRIDGVEMVTTVLTLTRAEPIDSGSYGCEVRPLKDAGDRILVHVTAAGTYPYFNNKRKFMYGTLLLFRRFQYLSAGHSSISCIS